VVLRGDDEHALAGRQAPAPTWRSRCQLSSCGAQLQGCPPAAGGDILAADAIGVTGCSRFGKGAFTIDAFDQRIVLTIPLESGSAGVPIWRGIPGEGAQSPDSTYGEQLECRGLAAEPDGQFAAPVWDDSGTTPPSSTWWAGPSRGRRMSISWRVSTHPATSWKARSTPLRSCSAAGAMTLCASTSMGTSSGPGSTRRAAPLCISRGSSRATRPPARATRSRNPARRRQHLESRGIRPRWRSEEPTVLAVSTLYADSLASQRPLEHRIERQLRHELQPSPSGVHCANTQGPPTQLREQHSTSWVRLAETSRHGSTHCPSRQLPEQQAELKLQASVSTVHGGCKAW
jgi:hypothetical protein